ncbi:unnamed protein product [Protopolystoma xenopodis]|uniref:Uncharacterized protein n=1 Tax=Protopolystoma xenopodis TaxID=117903 RepID=A0A3S5CRA1_9PLAT|nr:unnamed protein product [Protopolystoma xenopodis]
MKPGPLVLVGFGGCIDLNILALDLWNKVLPNNSDNLVESSYPEFSGGLRKLETLEDIVTDFTELFASGAAGERYVSNATLFQYLVSLAEELITVDDAPDVATSVFSVSRRSRDTLQGTHYSVESGEAGIMEEPLEVPQGSWWGLGGNALVMASRMSREGARVTLAARLTDRQQRKLPPNLRGKNL